MKDWIKYKYKDAEAIEAGYWDAHTTLVQASAATGVDFLDLHEKDKEKIAHAIFVIMHMKKSAGNRLVLALKEYDALGDACTELYREARAKEGEE